VKLEEIPSEITGIKKPNLVIKVKDNGIGIHPDKLDKIFTRFYQIEDTKITGTSGSGIGLSLTREYVNLHGGSVTVESAPNIGSCFTVCLPVDDKVEISNKIFHEKTMETKFNDSLPTNPADKKTVAGIKKPVVLVVEDNQNLRLYLRENLEEQYEIVEAENGKQALAMLESKMPDLILSDIMMEEMDGIEFCSKVKKDKITSHIPFVFLTAKDSEQQKLEGLKTGADDYIVKPFNFDILKTKIQNLIQLRQNIRDVFRTKMQIEPKDISITSLDEKFMAKALEIIEKHMADTSFSVTEFSKQMGISRMQLYNKIVSLTGSTPIEFIRILRLKRAVRLLTEGQLNVSEVAYQVGFSDPKYFSIQFKKEFNVQPSKYGKR
jgi:DNA-binding response OmpR family regulator